MVSKKIALVGAHGTGKTTLIYELAAKLKSLYHIHVGITVEGARESPLLISNEITLLAKINILGRQIMEESEKCRTHEFVICDRSVFEIVAYSKLCFPIKSKKKMRLLQDWHVPHYDLPLENEVEFMIQKLQEKGIIATSL